MKKNRKSITGFDLPLTLLGGISPKQFLNEYWQKKPLLIRGAIPGFEGLLSPEELAGLACEDDVQSRLIMQDNGLWHLEHGPFPEEKFIDLPERDWTLLVQPLNHHLNSAAELLQAFSFIPYSRIDDLMVSYAPDGGGVGPHIDSYDVFLLQGHGQRQWRISEQDDIQLLSNSPLRILKNFETQQEWVLGPGDMLYLPPQVAHWGIAVGACMTYSIGFRAPSLNELATEFLTFLQEKPLPSYRYQDPELKPQTHPAKISSAMTTQVIELLNHIKWSKQDVAEFLGHYLSEPHNDVIFEIPKAVSLTAFVKRLKKKGIVLDMKSQMFFDQKHIYMNGEVVKLSKVSAEIFKALANHKRLMSSSVQNGETEVMEQLHAWYLCGYLRFED